MTDGRPGSRSRLARGSHGAVVAPHHLASAAGLAILRAGGSAVDAAIATNAVLGVVTPQSCGLGGDAFWLIWDAAAGRQVALNGSGRAAAGSRRGGPAPGRPRDDPAARTIGHHRAGRGPLVGRCPRAGSAGCRRRTSSPRPSSWPPTGSRRRRASSTPWSGRAADRVDDRERRRVPAVYRPFGRPWRPGERVRNCGAGVDARGDRRRAGSRRSTLAISARAGRAGWTPPAARSRSTTCATTPRPGPIRSRSTTEASGSRPIRPTAPGSSPSRSWPSSPSSSHPARPRSARTG